MGALRGHLGQVLALMLLGASASASPPAGPIPSYTITIENLQFSPAELSVHRGDRIVWLNKDLFPHTATANNNAFDSQAIAAGSSWTYLADKAGVYSYSCAFHPGMHGTLKVR